MTEKGTELIMEGIFAFLTVAAENGEEWENYLGGYWNPVFDYVRKKELQKLFKEMVK